MALSRPRTTRRVLRGSALGLGLLVAGGITAPAAFAIEDTGDSIDRSDEESLPPVPLADAPGHETPALAPALTGDFGRGKDFAVQVEPSGPVPLDLDLSGAVFRATPLAAPVSSGRDDLVEDDDSYTCTTDAAGACTFSVGATLTTELARDGADAFLPAGTYELTQDSSSAGLAANTGSTTFSLCSGPDYMAVMYAIMTNTTPPPAADCDDEDPIDVAVGNDSLFRTSLVTTVTDVDTGDPLACAGYELTGPDYPHDGTAPAQTAPAAVTPAACVVKTTTEPTSPSSSSPETTTSAPVVEPTEDTDDETPVEDPTSSSSTSTSPSSPSELVEPLVGDDDPVSYGSGISYVDGVLVIEGWLIPGEGYLLTPTSTPEGYSPDVTDPFGIATTALQAAAGQPAAVARSLYTLAGGSAPTTDPSGGLAGAATTSAPVAGASVPTSSAAASSAATAAALATTGSPVATMALLGTGLVALGGGAMATSTIVRRRARQRA